MDPEFLRGVRQPHKLHENERNWAESVASVAPQQATLRKFNYLIFYFIYLMCRWSHKYLLS